MLIRAPRRRDLLLFQLMTALRSFLLINTALTLFFEMKGFGSENTFTFLAAINILIVVLEYPTGVIGDVYGHKLSVMVGYFTMAISVISVFLSPNLLMISFSAVLFAIGHTLNSGSDITILKAISKDLDTDFSRYQINILLSIALAGIVSPILYSIHPSIPFVLQTFLLIVSALILSLIRVPKKDRERSNNIFTTAKKGLQYLANNREPQYIIASSSVIGGFLNALKFLTGVYFILYGIAESAVGWFYAILLIASLSGTLLYSKYKHFATSSILYAIPLLLLSTLSLNNLLWHILFSTAAVIALSMFETYYNKHYLESTPAHIQSSMASIKSLSYRLSVSLFLGSLTVLSDSLENLYFFFGVVTILVSLIALFHYCSKDLYSLRKLT